jgi:hypothetical protein
VITRQDRLESEGRRPIRVVGRSDGCAVAHSLRLGHTSGWLGQPRSARRITSVLTQCVLSYPLECDAEERSGPVVGITNL